MYIYYLIALVVTVIFGIIFLYSGTENSAKLCLIGTLSAFILAGIFHGLTIYGMTSDVEQWTGEIISATYYPPWLETYQQSHTVTSTDSKGRVTSSYTYYTTEYANHGNYSEMNVAFGYGGTETMRIDNGYFDRLSNKFNNKTITAPYKSGYYSGDRNVYHTANLNKNLCIPITIEKSFQNRVKASPSSFSFNNVPKDIPVFEYPYSQNIFQSNRLLGDASKKIDIQLFDQFNARIGQFKKGNVIVVGFNSPDVKLGDYQKEKWLNGKKNDMVICYGIGTLEAGVTNVVWTKAFSWTTNMVLLANLEKMFNEEPIDNTILPKLEKEINTNFEKRKWSELDYIKIQPSSMWVWIYCIIMIIVQTGIWFFIKNTEDNYY